MEGLGWWFVGWLHSHALRKYDYQADPSVLQISTSSTKWVKKTILFSHRSSQLAATNQSQMGNGVVAERCNRRFWLGEGQGWWGLQPIAAVCAASLAAWYARGGIVREAGLCEKLTRYMLQLRWIATKHCFSCSLNSFCVLIWALVNDPWVVHWVAFYLLSMGDCLASSRWLPSRQRHCESWKWRVSDRRNPTSMRWFPAVPLVDALHTAFCNCTNHSHWHSI